VRSSWRDGRKRWTSSALPPSATTQATAASACSKDARTLEPSLAESAGALHSPHDAVVEPRAVLPALRALASASGRYSFFPGRTVVEVDNAAVCDHTGARTEGDVVVLCPGTATELLPSSAGMTVRNLQMLGLGPLDLRVALAGPDSLRYYPVFDLPERAGLQPPDPAVERLGAQLLVAPRADGGLTVGDTHVDDEPGAFGADEDGDRYLLHEAQTALAPQLPPVERRWTGSYLLRREGGPLVELTSDGRLVVAAAGGMGMTAAPAFAARALDLVAA
jgi:glycine/D-amino acid oxidase-like deaminating enzyme